MTIRAPRVPLVSGNRLDQLLRCAGYYLGHPTARPMASYWIQGDSQVIDLPAPDTFGCTWSRSVKYPYGALPPTPDPPPPPYSPPLLPSPHPYYRPPSFIPSYYSPHHPPLPPSTPPIANPSGRSRKYPNGFGHHRAGHLRPVPQLGASPLAISKRVRPTFAYMRCN